jgi:HlyD family secretion protein
LGDRSAQLGVLMFRWNRKIALLLAASVTAIAAAFLIAVTFHAEETSRAEPSRPAARKGWDAVAPGRIEPLSREIKVAAPVMGRIAEVLVKPNDKVAAGELLVRLDDVEAQARLTSADAQVALRKRARNDASMPKGSAERRKAEDAVADAETAAFEARVALDRTATTRRAGRASQAALDSARMALSVAQDRLREQQDALRRVKAASGTALPSRLEGELNVSRAELALAEAELEKTRIRTPAAGTVLQVHAKVGELAVPSSEQPLLTLGDLSALRVRAELDERDVAKVRVGQRVVVRADAFRGREFEGRVASIEQIVGPGRINARGPRKFSDVDVMEVVIDLADAGPLVSGMQVDAYFSSEPPMRTGSQ